MIKFKLYKYHEPETKKRFSFTHSKRYKKLSGHYEDLTLQIKKFQ